MADNNTIARPYAQAVFELAVDAGTLGSWSESLEAAGQILADNVLVEYLGNPGFNDTQRLEFLTGLFASAKVKLLAGAPSWPARRPPAQWTSLRRARRSAIQDRESSMRATSRCAGCQASDRCRIDDGIQRDRILPAITIVQFRLFGRCCFLPFARFARCCRQVLTARQTG